MKKTTKRTGTASDPPVVSILMGSASDAEIMQQARDILKEFNVSSEFKVLSAHRTPDDTLRHVEQAPERGVEVIIAGAGGAAHLPGVVAAKTILPVIGVPILTKSLGGMDSLLSIVQMPKGIPVATVAINGAANAGLLALHILALKYPEIAKRLDRYRKDMRNAILNTSV